MNAKTDGGSSGRVLLVGTLSLAMLVTGAVLLAPDVAVKKRDESTPEIPSIKELAPPPNDLPALALIDPALLDPRLALGERKNSRSEKDRTAHEEAKVEEPAPSSSVPEAERRRRLGERAPLSQMREVWQQATVNRARTMPQRDQRHLPADAASLEAYFEGLGFKLQQVKDGTRSVPRIVVAALPADLGKVGEVQKRKRLFLRTMLPLVLLANEELRGMRRNLLTLKGAKESGQALGVDEQAWLQDLYVRYEVEPGDLDELISRVDTVPPSLALAQSIEESGWGTSRFAVNGNAVFGQRTWSENTPGIVPKLRPEGAEHKVRSFEGLLDSVRSYMHNLNSHAAYAEFRTARALLRAKGERPSGPALVETLAGYAEREAYPERLLGLMRMNDLKDYDRARLETDALASRARSSSPPPGT